VIRDHLNYTANSTTLTDTILNEIAVGNARLLSETKEGEVFFGRLTKVVPKQQAEVDGLRQVIEWFKLEYGVE
jgi:hypothetical protein